MKTRTWDFCERQITAKNERVGNGFTWVYTGSRRGNGHCLQMFCCARAQWIAGIYDCARRAGEKGEENVTASIERLVLAVDAENSEAAITMYVAAELNCGMPQVFWQKLAEKNKFDARRRNCGDLCLRVAS